MGVIMMREVDDRICRRMNWLGLRRRAYKART
jgi:hypothetical protein